MLESLRKASAWLGLSDLNQGEVCHFLGLGGPPSVALGVASPIGVLPVSSGKGCHLFSLGDCLGIGMGGVAVGSCSFIGVVFHGGMGGGNRGVPPNRMWYKVARAPLSGCEQWHRVTWQEERKSWQLLLSSPEACSSKSCMYLTCSLWSNSAWEILWTAASPMALEQAASAFWIKLPLIVLASLTTSRKWVLPSRTENRLSRHSELPANRWLWLLPLMQYLGTHSGVTLPPVTR